MVHTKTFLKQKDDEFQYYAIPDVDSSVKRMPVSLRIILESILRHCGQKGVTQDHIETLLTWNQGERSGKEVPFIVGRVLLQDFTGVPLIVDLAAMRDAVAKHGGDPSQVEPSVPVDLVIDHSLRVDVHGTANALQVNMEREIERNHERYALLKWGQQAFKTLRIVPPGRGIVHQVNLEYLAQVALSDTQERPRLMYPDSLVGTDSHTTMINGLGVVGWGVGGIEAEAAMLGLPSYLPVPKVTGVHLSGKMRPGTTATDLVLHLTEQLRNASVVGEFVEFFGPGVEALSLAQRATIANMAPEYGATMGFFPIDENTLQYLEMTGRSKDHIQRVAAYYKAQSLFGIPKEGEIDYARVLECRLDRIVPSVAGPKRPQDRLSIDQLKPHFQDLLKQDIAKGGYACEDFPKQKKSDDLTHGSVVIAAITSCTNTSNPEVMVAAGLLAQKACECGLRVAAHIKTSLAPGSRVVTDYLEASGLQRFLDQLGFNLVGYGCTTCIGNSGPLSQAIEAQIQEKKLVVASVLSGNRNFEARIHGSVKANFLMSPPLVVAYALAGRVDIDFKSEALGKDEAGNPVYLKDLWPSEGEIQTLIEAHIDKKLFQAQYAHALEGPDQWQSIEGSEGVQFKWDPESTYIKRPPFFDISKAPDQARFQGLRPLMLLGDSVTTDHISPAGVIPRESTAGLYLQSRGVQPAQFNSYGARRGHDGVMTRGTFANTRIKNQMLDGTEGGYTLLMPEGKATSVYECAQAYKERGIGLIVFAGKDYGMGSSRDWAAKGTRLLGVRAVVAQSFERIHRSNLIGMGVLPLEFMPNESWSSAGITAQDSLSIEGTHDRPGARVTLLIHRPDGSQDSLPLKVRIDTETEATYFKQGGILPFMLHHFLP